MTCRSAAVRWDARDPERLAGFWATLRERDRSGTTVRADGPTAVALDLTPTTTPKTVQSRIHLDLATTSVATATGWYGGPGRWAPSTPTSARARRRPTWCWPTPRATSCASSHRTTASWPAPPPSGRSPRCAPSRCPCHEVVGGLGE